MVTSASRAASARADRPRLSAAAIRFLLPVVVFAALIAVWELLSDSGTLSKIVLPAPSSIADSFGNEVTSSAFYPDLFATLEEMLIGSLIGMLVGFVGGLIVAVSPLGRSLVQPVMIGLQAVPGLVLAPLMLIWFGYGLNSKIALVVLSTFFPLFVTTVQGIRSTPGEYLSLMEAMQSSPVRTLLTVRIPYASPLIFAGIKAAIPTAFSAAVVSEFIGATKGLGLRVLSYNESLQIPEVFALVLIMVIIGVFLYYATELLDRRLIFWRGRS